MREIRTRAHSCQVSKRFNISEKLLGPSFTLPNKYSIVSFLFLIFILTSQSAVHIDDSLFLF